MGDKNIVYAASILSFSPKLGDEWRITEESARRSSYFKREFIAENSSQEKAWVKVRFGDEAVRGINEAERLAALASMQHGELRRFPLIYGWWIGKEATTSLPYTAIAMELLEGPSFDELMMSWRSLNHMPTEDDALSLLHALLLALQQANAVGLIHGDLRPPNVIEHGGRPYVVDWSDSSESDSPGADARFWSPERTLRREPASHADDVWAAAMISLQYLQGDHPLGRACGLADSGSIGGEILAREHLEHVFINVERQGPRTLEQALFSDAVDGEARRVLAKILVGENGERVRTASDALSLIPERFYASASMLRRTRPSPLLQELMLEMEQRSIQMSLASRSSSAASSFSDDASIILQSIEDGEAARAELSMLAFLQSATRILGELSHKYDRETVRLVERVLADAEALCFNLHLETVLPRLESLIELVAAQRHITDSQPDRARATLLMMEPFNEAGLEFARLSAMATALGRSKTTAVREREVAAEELIGFACEVLGTDDAEARALGQQAMLMDIPGGWSSEQIIAAHEYGARYKRRPAGRVWSLLRIAALYKRDAQPEACWDALLRARDIAYEHRLNDRVVSVTGSMLEYAYGQRCITESVDPRLQNFLEDGLNVAVLFWRESAMAMRRGDLEKALRLLEVPMMRWRTDRPTLHRLASAFSNSLRAELGRDVSSSLPIEPEEDAFFYNDPRHAAQHYALLALAYDLPDSQKIRAIADLGDKPDLTQIHDVLSTDEVLAILVADSPAQARAEFFGAVRKAYAETTVSLRWSNNAKHGGLL